MDLLLVRPRGAVASEIYTVCGGTQYDPRDQISPSI